MKTFALNLLALLFVFQFSFSQENTEVNVECLLGEKYQEDVKQYIENERTYKSVCKEYYSKNIIIPVVIGNYFYSSNPNHSKYIKNESILDKFTDIVFKLRFFDISNNNDACSTEAYEFTKARFDIYENAFKYYYLLDKNETQRLKAKEKHDLVETQKLEAIVKHRENENKQKINELQAKRNKMTATSQNILQEIENQKNALIEQKQTIVSDNLRKQDAEIKKLPLNNFVKNKEKIVQKYAKLNKDALSSIQNELEILNQKIEKEKYLISENAEIQNINSEISELENTDFYEILPMKAKFDDSEFVEKENQIINLHKESLKNNALILLNLNVEQSKLQDIFKIVFNEEAEEVLADLEKNKKSYLKRELKKTKNNIKDGLKEAGKSVLKDVLSF